MNPHDRATELLIFAGHSETPGRPFSDPVYRAVTEGRQDAAVKAGQFYSSCGDLAHWLLYRLGVRAIWVNRAEHTGWVYGLRNNVSLLAGRSCFGLNPIARPALRNEEFEPGDIVVISAMNSGKTHVLCVTSHDHSSDELFTAEYGQPHGALRARKIRRKSSGLFIDERRIDSVLKLDTVMAVSRSARQLVEAEPLATYERRFPAEVA